MGSGITTIVHMCDKDYREYLHKMLVSVKYGKSSIVGLKYIGVAGLAITLGPAAKPQINAIQIDSEDKMLYLLAVDFDTREEQLIEKFHVDLDNAYTDQLGPIEAIALKPVEGE